MNDKVKSLLAEIELDHFSPVETPPKDCVNCCQFYGETLHPNQIKMIYNHLYESNGVYVRCENGQVQCYLESGFADKPATPLPSCPSQTSHLHRQLGVYIAKENKAKLWPHGLVCIGIDTDSFSDSETNLLMEGLFNIEVTTNIRFILYSQCNSFRESGEIPTDACGICESAVVITQDDSSSCYAHVGMLHTNGYLHESFYFQLLVLNSLCFGEYSYTVQIDAGGIILHEMGHTIGLHHEHQHNDTNLLMFWDNIDPKSIDNFLPLNHSLVEMTPYDPTSVMHYPEYFFNGPKRESNHVFCTALDRCDGSSDECIPESTRFCGPEEGISDECVEPSMSYCQPLDHQMGQQIGYSAGDIATLKGLYPNASSISLFVHTEAPTRAPTRAPTPSPKLRTETSTNSAVGSVFVSSLILFVCNHIVLKIV